MTTEQDNSRSLEELARQQRDQMNKEELEAQDRRAKNYESEASYFDREKRALEYEQQNFPESMVLSALTPEEVRRGARLLSKEAEYMYELAPQLADRWGMTRFASGVRSRANALQEGVDLTQEQKDDLDKRGITHWRMVPKHEAVEPYEIFDFKDIPSNGDEWYEYGLGIPASDDEWIDTFGINPHDDLKFQHMSAVMMQRAQERARIEQENNEIRKENGKREKMNQKQQDVEEEHKKREEEAEKNRVPVVRELKAASLELIAREKVAADAALHEETGGDLGSLAKEFFQPRNQHVSTFDYWVLTNAPATDAVPNLSFNPLDGNTPENREKDTRFGDGIDAVIRLNEIIGLCEKPSELLELKQTEGWKYLFEGMNEEEWVGKIAQWKNEVFDVNAPQTTGRTAEDVRNETQEGKRGALTRNGNLWNRAETHQEKEETRGHIRRFLKDRLKLTDSDAEAVERIAKGLYEGWGMAATRGTETYVERAKEDDPAKRIRKGDILWKEKGKTPKTKVTQEGFPTSDDRVKVITFGAWQQKQLQSSTPHPGGVDANLGQIDSIGCDFLDYNTVTLKNAQGEDVGMLTWKELMWGEKVNTASQSSESSGILLRRLSHRRKTFAKLGEMPWLDNSPHQLRNMRLRHFFAGREGGLYSALTTRAKDPKEVGSVDYWRGLNKTINIVASATAVATGGKLRGKSIGQIENEVNNYKKRIKETIVQGILEANENKPWLEDEGKVPGYPANNGKDAFKAMLRVSGFGAIN